MSTRSAASPSCSPATSRPRARCVTHPSGWKLEAVDSDPRRIIRVRLHAPEIRHRQESVRASLAVSIRRDNGRCRSFANRFAGSAIALNSSALPAGSSRNIVACSPGSPAKRTVGAMTNSVPALVSRAASAFHSSIVQHQPEMRHRHIFAVDRIGSRAGAAARARDGRRSDGRRGRNRPNGRRCAPRGSRAVRRRSAAPRRDRRPGTRGEESGRPAPTRIATRAKQSEMRGLSAPA